MESVRCFAYVCILMILKSQLIVGNTDCDCKGTKKMVNRVRKILLKDMFDMKLQNDMLSSKINRLERMFQEQFPVSVSSASQDTSRNGGVDSEGLGIDTDTEQANEAPEMDSRLESLIIAFQSEKKQRMQTESVVRFELRTLNDSFNAFTSHMDAAFTKSVNSMTEKIKNFELNVTDSLSDVKNEYKSSIGDVQKLLSGVIEANLTELQDELNSINQNLSRLDMEVSSVIDNIILNKTGSCEPYCRNGGVCFKDNTCRCKIFTEGTRCERLNKCDIIEPFPGVSISYFGDRNPGTVASYTCDDDEYTLFPSDLESSKCTKDFKWNPEPPKCLRPCTNYEFQCESDGSCISFAGRCNETMDCSDGSDEIHCHCDQNKIQCPTGKCISKSWICDGDDDCWDGFDESNCGSVDLFDVFGIFE